MTDPTPEYRKRRSATIKRYYQKHKKEYLEKCRKYRLENPERRREIVNKSADKHRKTKSDYYRKNREALLAKCSQYQRDHPDVIKASKARYRARKYAAAIRDFTRQQWVEMQERYDHRCVYCGKRFKGNLTQDHVIPLFKCGNHTLSNIVPACRSCNSIKGTRPALCPVQPLLLSVNAPLKGRMKRS